MNTSIKSLLSLVVIVSGGLGAIFWFGDSNRSGMTIWIIRIFCPVIFLGIIYLLFWDEFLRDKKVKATQHIDFLIGIEQFEQNLRDQQNSFNETDDKIMNILETGGTVKDIIKDFGGREKAYQAYAEYVKKQSIGKALNKEEGTYYEVVWGVRYDTAGSALMNLGNLVTSIIGLNYTTAKEFVFSSFHRFTPKEMRAIKFRMALNEALPVIPRLGVLVLIIFSVWNFGLSIMEKEFYRFSTLLGAVSFLGIFLLLYIARIIAYWNMLPEFDEICRGHFLFAGVEKVSNEG